MYKGFEHGRDFFHPSHNPPMTLLCEESRWEGYGRDDGRDQGRDENQRILYFRGFRAIDGRDGGFLIKNEYFQTSQRHLTSFSASAYDFLSVRYGDADTFLTTFQQFPPWEHFIPTVGTNALEPVLILLSLSHLSFEPKFEQGV